MMELRKPAEMLLHTVQSPLLPLLAPSIYRAPTQRISSLKPVAYKPQQSLSTRRTFSLSIRSRQQATASKETNETNEVKPANEQPTQSNESTPTSESTRAKTAEDFTSAVEDRLSFLKPRKISNKNRSSDDIFSPSSSNSTSTYTPRFADRALNDAASDRTDSASPKKKPTSVSDFLAVFNERRDRQSGSRASTGRGGGGINISRMADDTLFPSTPSTIIKPTVEETHLAPPFRVGPSLGRSIAISEERGLDIGRAFRTLDGHLTVNGVRRDMYKQRFHERPGLKRKRLKSERWRARFKRDFQAVARRVQEMRRQGW